MNKKLLVTTLTIGTLILSGVATANASTVQNSEKLEKPKMSMFLKGDCKVADFLGLTQDEIKSSLESGKTLEEIAVAQGKTADELKTFMESARQEMQTKMKEKLAEDVSSGKITQEQADKMLEHKPGDGTLEKKMGRGEHNFTPPEVADFLGLTQDEIKSSLESGKTLEEIAVAQGKTADELKTFMESARQEMQTKMKEKLAEDVSSGKITQEQADKMLEHKPEKNSGQKGSMSEKPMGKHMERQAASKE